jgi:hypothetical protein
MKPELIYKYFSKHKNFIDTINNIKKDGHKVGDTTDYQIYKKYFMNAPIKNIKEINAKKCDIDKLEKLLVGKYGLVKMRINTKLQFLSSI